MMTDLKLSWELQLLGAEDVAMRAQNPCFNSLVSFNKISHGSNISYVVLAAAAKGALAL